VFDVNDIGEGHALKYVGYELLQKYDLINKFQVSQIIRYTNNNFGLLVFHSCGAIGIFNDYRGQSFSLLYRNHLSHFYRLTKCLIQWESLQVIYL